MLHRLIDLVVLVAEMSQTADRSYHELDRELIERGYSAEEIEQAVFWFSSRGDAPTDKPVAVANRQSVRVLSEFERLSINGECHAFLLRLLNLGIIDIAQFDAIMTRAIPVGSEKIHLNDVKAIACAVVFNKEPGEVEEDLLEQFGEDAPAT